MDLLLFFVRSHTTPLQLVDQVKTGVFFITCVCPVYQPLLFYKVALLPLLPNLPVSHHTDLGTARPSGQYAKKRRHKPDC